MKYLANEKRYTKMVYKKVGESGLKLPIVSLGLWHNFGDNADFKKVKTMLFTSFDNGITHFDLANNYGPKIGGAERTFGKVISKDLKPYRDELIISTKAGYKMWEGPYGDGGSRKYLISSLDQSLNRMGLDYVDIFYHHRMDKETPLEETMLALYDIIRSGKALYVGLSNYNGETMLKAQKILNELKVPFIINQNAYNILNRTVEENGLLQASYNSKKGVICFSPLAQGLLTNRYLNGIPEDSRVKTDGRFLKESSINEQTLSKIISLNNVAKERNETLAKTALKWLISKKEITSVLVGASKVEQILDNLGVIDSPEFTKEQLESIENVVKQS